MKPEKTSNGAAFLVAIKWGKSGVEVGQEWGKGKRVLYDEKYTINLSFSRFLHSFDGDKPSPVLALPFGASTRTLLESGA